MSRLGLTVRSRIFDDLTPIGPRLVSFYEKNIENTQYFGDYIHDDDVEKQVLSEYENCACICQLAESSKERDLLREVMFSRNFRSVSQLENLGLVLYLVKRCRELGIDFTGSTFRGAVFFGSY